MNYHFITGASRGIGKAMALAILEDDDKNMVTGMSRSNTIEHPNYTHITADLSNIDFLLEFEFPTMDDIDRIVLVNNAATLGQITHLGNFDSEGLDSTFNVNLIAPIILINTFIKRFQSIDKEKIIINITSGAATSPYDGWATYSTSKAALDMVSRVGAQEQAMKEYPVKILSIAPGVVETQMQDAIRKVSEEDFSRKEKFIDLKENGQLISPERVAREYLAIIKDPDSIPETIHRIVI